jgi:hypothetical protein
VETEQSKFAAIAFAFYKYMEERSYVNEHQERQFKGNLIKAYKEAGGHMGWYSEVRKLLESPELDPCMLLVQKGNPHQPSIVNLYHPPSPDWGNFTRGDLTDPPTAATILEARTERLEAWRESLGGVNLAEVLRNFEMRITRLENKTGEGTGKD